HRGHDRARGRHRRGPRHEAAPQPLRHQLLKPYISDSHIVSVRLRSSARMSMPRVEWAVLCDLAYFDAARNLGVIGMQTQAVPSFSPGARRFAIAAHVPGLRPDPSVSVSLSSTKG